MHDARILTALAPGRGKIRETESLIWWLPELETTLVAMASNVRIVHTYEVSEDTFWDRLFLDEEYNRRLYVEALRFHSYRVTRG